MGKALHADPDAHPSGSPKEKPKQNSVFAYYFLLAIVAGTPYAQ
jgi:hypothetical protein